MNEKSKVLVLLSGGLDSTLAVKAMIDQDLDVEAAIFTTPFCLCDKCSAGSVVKTFGIKAHTVILECHRRCRWHFFLAERARKAGS